jgi:hypothetical protein
VLAFLGKNWARIVLTIMTVIYTLVLLAALTTAAGDTGSMLVFLVIVGACVVGTVILFLPAPSRYFGRARG